MAFPLVPVALGAGVVAILALIAAGRGKDLKSPEPPRPNPDPPPAPPPPPQPNRFPPSQQTAVVNTDNRIVVRAAPTRDSARLGAVPRFERVAILEADPRPPTEGAPQGWWRIRTQGGLEGFGTAEFLFFGSDEEARMTDEEFRDYNERRMNRERPIFSGAGGVSWYAPMPWAAAARGRFGRTCVSDGGCWLRSAPSDQALTSLIVENGGQVQLLRFFPGPKTSLNSPGVGGWAHVRYFDRATGRVFTGYLPNEWLV